MSAEQTGIKLVVISRPADIGKQPLDAQMAHLVHQSTVCIPQILDLVNRYHGLEFVRIPHNLGHRLVPFTGGASRILQERGIEFRYGVLGPYGGGVSEKDSRYLRNKERYISMMADVNQAAMFEIMFQNGLLSAVSTEVYLGSERVSIASVAKELRLGVNITQKHIRAMMHHLGHVSKRKEVLEEVSHDRKRLVRAGYAEAMDLANFTP